MKLYYIKVDEFSTTKTLNIRGEKKALSIVFKYNHIPPIRPIFHEIFTVFQVLENVKLLNCEILFTGPRLSARLNWLQISSLPTFL
jgi:hypothetical protein